MFFLYFLPLTLALDCTSKRSFIIKNSTYPFVLEELPYKYSYLSEVLSETMLILHHDTHQKSYLTNLNAYLAPLSALYSTNLATLNSAIYQDINLQKYAGGLYNHYLYWWVLTSPGCSAPLPSGNLSRIIGTTWGNFTAFQTQFDYQSINLFGNGWVWLCVNSTYGLEIRTSYYQLNPMMNASSVCYPVMGNDLWEHAYYLRYTTDRTTYIQSFWDMIDWAMVEFFYNKFGSQRRAVPF